MISTGVHLIFQELGYRREFHSAHVSHYTGAGPEWGAGGHFARVSQAESWPTTPG